VVRHAPNVENHWSSLLLFCLASQTTIMTDGLPFIQPTMQKYFSNTKDVFVFLSVLFIFWRSQIATKQLRLMQKYLLFRKGLFCHLLQF